MIGAEAIVLGAYHAGCDVVAAATNPVLQPLLAAAKCKAPESRLTLSQTADDAEAVGRAITAAQRGGRTAALTTSAGLRAAAENVALAHVAEAPIVVIHCQHLREARDPNAAGEFDVALVRHLAPGSLPIPVLAAADVQSAYRLTGRAFDIAEQLSTPVILLISAPMLTADEAVEATAAEPPTKPSGQPTGRRSDARDALGDEIGSLFTRLRDKIVRARAGLECVRADLDPDAETLVVSYGAADRAACQAIAAVRAAGGRVSHLTVYSIWPIPEAALRRARTPFIRRLLLPELNLGLYAEALRGVLSGVKIESIARCDGRPIEPASIARRITDWPCG